MLGSKTRPAVAMFAFSGCSSVLPPTVELIWLLVSPALAELGFGPPLIGAELQRMASAPLAPLHGSTALSALGSCPANRSETPGARKPVEYVPRTVRSRTGRQRPPSL